MRTFALPLLVFACTPLSSSGDGDPGDTGTVPEDTDGGGGDAASPDAAAPDAAAPDAAALDGPLGDAPPPGDGGIDGAAGPCEVHAPFCVDRYSFSVCDPETGREVVEPCPSGAGCMDGQCTSECLLGLKDPSYIGCAYWSVDLDNYPDPFGDPAAVPHAVVIANPSAGEALVTIETMADVQLPNPELHVPPGEVGIYTFPRLDVDGTGITNHSFRLSSSWPVVALQFNPLNNEGVASNDGSLLLPEENLGREYLVVSWPTTPIPEEFGLPPQHGYLTVVATRPGVTTVRVTPAGNVNAGEDLEAMEAGEEHSFDLQQFEVLNLEAAGDNLFAPQDLTGSIVEATQPVAVFGGHEEAVVGDGCCAEHLEQQMFPVETLGGHYLAAKAESRGGPGDVWRILAVADDTTILTIPAQGNDGLFRLNRGEWREIDTGDSFEVAADKPVYVAQYLRSQEDTGDFIGDPALILAVPTSQFRSDYVVLTPADYAEDWLTVMRPAGVEVQLDGAPIPNDAFSAFGSGDWEMAWVRVDDGTHRLSADQPFGLTAYGYSAAVSYGFPAGLDLRGAGAP